MADKGETSDQGMLLLGIGESFQQEVLDLAADCALLVDLSGDQLKQLTRYMHAYEAKQAATLFREGEPGAFVCILVQGRVDVLKEGRPGDPAPKWLTTIRAGKTLGEMSLVDGQPYSATAVAATDCILLVLTRRNFDEILEQHPKIGVRLLRQISLQLSQRLRRTTGILVDYLE